MNRLSFAELILKGSSEELGRPPYQDELRGLLQLVEGVVPPAEAMEPGTTNGNLFPTVASTLAECTIRDMGGSHTVQVDYLRRNSMWTPDKPLWWLSVYTEGIGWADQYIMLSESSEGGEPFTLEASVLRQNGKGTDVSAADARVVEYYLSAAGEARRLGQTEYVIGKEVTKRVLRGGMVSVESGGLAE